MPSSWKSIRHRIEWICLGSAATMVPILGRNALFLLARFLGSTAYYLDRRSRHIAVENLRAVLQGRYPEHKLHSIARRSFVHFAQVQLDNLWSPRLDADNYLNFIDLEFESSGIEELARERGAIWVTPHYGNFEWTSLIFGFRGFSFKVVAQPFKNPLLDPLITTVREHSGHQIIAQRGAMLRLLRHIKSGGHAAFLLDLSLPPNRAATIINCMDHLLCTTKLHAELASRTGLPIIPTISLPRADGGYTIKVRQPLVDLKGVAPRDIAQQCWDSLEPFIFAEPAPWLWAYKHWRYLPDTGHANDQPYPSYANRNSKFDKLLRELADVAP